MRRLAAAAACLILVACLPLRVRAAVDSDGDGVPDAWKKSGSVTITLANGKQTPLDLRQDGPMSQGRKDILVWVAWMEDEQHSHKPDQRAMQIVRKAFANAPIQNPDGSQGLRLHVFFSPTPVAEVSMLGAINPDGTYDWREFDRIKSRVFPKELQGIFHFCLFAHDYHPRHSSGISKDIGGYDLLVSLGAFGQKGQPAGPFSQAGTFMHELGHNLGLRHGGDDNINYKPNYISVMNYFFQLIGIPLDKEAQFDYSRFSLTANEASLDRGAGLTTNPALNKYGTQYFCETSKTSRPVTSIVGPIDWDCSKQQSGKTAQDINRDNARTTLSGFDDWKNVQLKYTNAGAGVGPVADILRPVDELSLEAANRIALHPVPRVATALKKGQVTVEWLPVPSDRIVAYEVIRASEAGDETLVGVVNADGRSLIDKDVKPGSYGYTVRGVYKPFGNSETPEVSQQLAQHPYLVKGIVLDFMVGLRVIETAPVKAGVEVPTREIAPVLLRTVPSSAPRLEVR